MGQPAGLVASQFAVLGVEGTRGTLSSNLKTVPIKSPQVTPQQKWLRNQASVGSPVVLIGDVAGVRNDQYDLKCDLYADVAPILLRAALGSTDTTGAAPSNTTLAASAVANAATISTTASIAAGSIIGIGTIGSPTYETHLTTAVSGAGPYTVTLALPLVNAQSNAATVTGFTSHKIGLLNSLSTASQPPSVSVQDFDGFNTSQLLACQLDELTIDWGAEKTVELSAKFLGQPFTTPGNPSASPSSESFAPGWSVQSYLNSAYASYVKEGQIVIKRGTKAVFTGGKSTPEALFAGPIDVSGKLTYIVESGDPTLGQGLSDATLPFVFVITDPASGHMVQVQMSAVQPIDPKRTRSDIMTMVETNFSAESNATDAVGGGLSPILTWTGNAITTSY